MWTDGQMDGRTDGRTDRHTEEVSVKEFAKVGLPLRWNPVSQTDLLAFPSASKHIYHWACVSLQGFGLASLFASVLCVSLLSAATQRWWQWGLAGGGWALDDNRGLCDWPYQSQHTHTPCSRQQPGWSHDPSRISDPNATVNQQCQEKLKYGFIETINEY